MQYDNVILINSEAEFFTWLRSNSTNGRLAQRQVDATHDLISRAGDIDLDDLYDILLAMITTLKPWVAPVVPKPRLSKADITKTAREHGLSPAGLKAVLDIESRGRGFRSDNTPVILFERHWFYRKLTEINWITHRDNMVKAQPLVCNKVAGGYQAMGSWAKMKIASALNKDMAYESASWGLGQIMGFHWKALGYKSVQDFVDAMFESEVKQLDAVCRFIKMKGIDDALNKRHWKTFAYTYNGSGYAKHNYHGRLSDAYNDAVKAGWEIK